MAEGRRSLGEAVSLTPEKLAFIHGTKTLPVAAEKPASAPVRPAPTVVELPTREFPGERREATEPEGTTEPETAREIHEPRKTIKPRSRGGEEPRPLLIADPLVPLTTRIRPATADSLRRACLEQKLARREPSTQQEIVELALHDWLRRNGLAA